MEFTATLGTEIVTQMEFLVTVVIQQQATGQAGEMAIQVEV